MSSSAGGASAAADERERAKHARALEDERHFLRHLTLASKVMALVASPLHKKLLNLAHDWLRTYLPHCLAKVRRGHDKRFF